MTSKLHEECGVFGIARTEGVSAPADTLSALYALQHRGQRSCGIAWKLDGQIALKKGQGLLSDVFDDKETAALCADTAIGHVRYAYSSDCGGVDNSQPILMRHMNGTLCVAHNGRLVNGPQLRAEAEMRGAVFSANVDAEVIAYMVVRERLRAGALEDAVINAMQYMVGAYSLVFMSGKKLIAARDPNGFRPLCMGTLPGAVVFASESCALDAIGATFVRDVAPGEVVVVKDGQVRSLNCGIRVRPSLCVFEYIYFARPDSVIDGMSVDAVRQHAGELLAARDQLEADVVVGVPDSGLSAAMGYSRRSGLPYAIGLVKNRYVGRTFIQPTQLARESAVKLKLNALSAAVRGKRVVLVDDSIVRGTTSARIVSQLREAGAREVHMRVSSPPFLHPCYFGTDIKDRDLLIANRCSLEEICRFIGADSLRFLKLEDIREIFSGHGLGVCDGCFSGAYPVPVPDAAGQSTYGRSEE